MHKLKKNDENNKTRDKVCARQSYRCRRKERKRAEGIEARDMIELQEREKGSRADTSDSSSSSEREKDSASEEKSVTRP